MIQIKEEIEKLYKFNPDEETILKLEKWRELFIEYNSHTNLMSRNDISVLYEKHVLDSLSIVLFEEFKNAQTILDVGCGGGFPSLILAIFFPDKKIYAVDSTLKKINFINLVKDKLNLLNIEPLAARIETLDILKADIVTNRAVGKIADIWKISSDRLKKGGYFVSYKAKTAQEEADFALKTYKNIGKPTFIEYNLPLSENYTRKLVIFQKK